MKPRRRSSARLFFAARTALVGRAMRAICCTDDSVLRRKCDGAPARESLPYSQVTQNVM
jgi:hypothetical protein